jgi:predicted PurR-regulated permease PerM
MRTTEANRPAPIYISSRQRAGVVAAGLVAFALICWAAPVVPTILLLSGLLVLVLSFPMRPLSRVLPRAGAVVVVIGGAMLLLVLAGAAIGPRLLAELPRYLDTLAIYQNTVPGLSPDGSGWDAALTGVGRALAAESRETVSAILGGVLAAFSGVIGVLFFSFSLLVATTYILSDARPFEAAYLRAVPRHRRRDAHELSRTLHATLTRILGAALISNTIEGLLAFGFLTLLGVPYAALLGVVMWLTAFVPIFGAWLGGIPAVLVALTVSPKAALLTAVGYLTINLLDGNVLTPRLQGGALRLHPIIVLLAVLGAGQALGLLGILFTLPVLAVVRVVGGFFAARLRTPTPPGATSEG